MTQWTPEQAQAIQARNQNLLVAAAAGSGKTAVLVERIIRLVVEDQVDINQLLVVTFTNAAAGEMRERIAAAIQTELDARPVQEDHMRKQLTLLNQANISTLHAFCIEVVRANFHLIDLDPSFRIGDGAETSLLQMEALTEVFERAYEEADPGFLSLVEAYGGNRGDEPLQELVVKVYQFIQSKPYPEQWLLEQSKAFEMNLEAFEATPWAQAIGKSVQIRLTGALEAFEAAWEGTQATGGPDTYQSAIEADLELTRMLLHRAGEGVTALYQAIQGISHQRLPRAPKEGDPELKERVKDLRDEGKKIITKLQETYFCLSPEEYLLEMNEMAPLMEALCRLVAVFGNAYQLKKQEKGILDFNDLEHKALAILEDPLVARQYQKRFKYIFIDEYQDSNIVQESIINRIKGERNLFMVGDVKQSIYRFRLADPSLFMEKYQRFQRDGQDGNLRIDLSKNFRSRGEILKGVNFLFKNLMTETLGEVDYDEAAYLYEGGSFPPLEAPAIELNLLEKDAAEVDWEALAEEGGDALEELEAAEAEARLVVQRIKALLNEPIYDSKIQAHRLPVYQDMVILLRATQHWAPVFYEVLTEAGIPAYADMNTGYFENIEISQFMNLLKLIDNKRQDLPLLSVMRSPIGQFTTEELIDIRIAFPRGAYYEAVESYLFAAEEQGEMEAASASLEEGVVENSLSEGTFLKDSPSADTFMENSLKKKLKAFFQQLTEWAEVSRYLKLEEFIWRLLMETGFYHYAGAMPGGLQRQANLRVLLDRAVQFQKTSMKGLFNFIRFISKIQKSRGDMGSAKVLNENDQVVRIMSIHKSKGLEFPIVIVAGLGKNFNLRDVSQPVLLHKDLGIGPQYVNSQLRISRETLAKIAMKDQIRLESLSEEMRVLYVALTRPKERLVLVASGRKLAQLCQKWNRGVSLYGLYSARSYLAWLLNLLCCHPHGAPLRELAGKTEAAIPLFQDDSCWQIRLVGLTDLYQTKKQENQRKEILREQLTKVRELPQLEELDQGEREAISQRLSWVYPRREALLVPSKLSVTDVKLSQFKKLESLGYKIPPLVKMPQFIETTREFTAAEKGTILHFVLQHLDLKRIDSAEAIQLQVESMCHRHLMTLEQAATVQVEKLVTFFQSEVGRRMLKAPRVYREVPFNLKRQANQVLDHVTAEETLLVQGIIDCYFQEGEEWVLLDYKSDYLMETEKASIKEKYSAQLDLYQEALEKITGRSVKEKILYLFHLDEALLLGS